MLKNIVIRNRQGSGCAIPSVCSARPEAIRAALLLADGLGHPILVEATSNQVNQFGGYTGMTPDDYIRYLDRMIRRHEVNRDLVTYGGDHLGPHPWKSFEATEALAHARVMVSDFVTAGFSKIHLDCSQGCAGEPMQVSDKVAAERAADLAVACENAADEAFLPVYVIGTEVPPPGGALTDDGSVLPTEPGSIRKTLTNHRDAFFDAGIGYAWERVIALVVQPGLEFSSANIHRFDTSSPDLLSPQIQDLPNICFEAHSTDYQSPDIFPDLARRNFAILKVGPALTHAYRQALYALDHIRAHLESGRTGTELADCMEAQMQRKPAYWQEHVSGDRVQQRIFRHFGYSDRIRYYWDRPEAQKAVAELLSALPQTPPMPLLEQYFAVETICRSQTLLSKVENWTEALILARIQEALLPYFLGR